MHIQKIENKQEYIESTNVDAIQVGGTHRNRSKRGKRKRTLPSLRVTHCEHHQEGKTLPQFNHPKGEKENQTQTSRLPSLPRATCQSLRS